MTLGFTQRVYLVIALFCFAILCINFQFTNVTNSFDIVPASIDSIILVIQLNNTSMDNHSHMHDSPRGKDSNCCGSLKEKRMTSTEGGEDYYRLAAPQGNEIDPRLYIFSAHFDVKRSVVDILGVSLRPHLPFRPVCVFVTHDQRDTKTVPGSVQSLHQGRSSTYPELVIHCPLTHAHLTPAFLRLPASNSTDIDRTIPVQYPAREYRNVTVCYPVGHSKYSRIDEFLNSMIINRILGADKSFWYIHSISASMRPALDYFERCGQLEVIQARLPDILRKDIVYYGQIVNMHDCFYRNRYTSKYIVLQDMDEVLLPHKDSSWLTLLERLKRTEPKIGSVVFTNAFFSKSKDYVKSTTKHGYIKMLSHFFHGGIYPYYRRSKYIVIPDSIDILQVHGPRHIEGYVPKLLNVSDGLLHHYRFTRETYSQEDRSIMRFSLQLKNQTYTAWQCIGVID